METSFVLEEFPSVEAAFAYGSAVYQQKGDSEKSKNMLDLIFIVKNAQEWHEENLKRNNAHYSRMMSLIGSKSIASLQKNYGARIYYNSFVKIREIHSKYGVIEEQDLKRDLDQWETLYLSGRLHKPVKWIKRKDELDHSVKNNLHFAMKLSLLLLMEEKRDFSLQQLFEQIASISYMGDIRSGIAEHPHKVRNIVEPNLNHFMDLYSEILMELKNEKIIDLDLEKRSWRMQNVDLDYLCENMPASLGISEFIGRNDFKEKISERIRGIVRTSSFSQSMKGILTAGIPKSIYYASRKVLKSFSK